MPNKQTVIVGQSKLHGKGLFAAHTIKSGEKVLHIKGKVLKLPAFFRLPRKVADNTYRFSPNEYLSPQNELGDYLNHSCIPNSKIVKKNNRLYLIALRDIKKDSEIYLDYSTILAKDDYWIMKCNCGEKTCRKKIKRYNTLQKNLLKEYMEAKIIPSYILFIKSE